MAEIWLDGDRVATIALYDALGVGNHIVWSAAVARGAHQLSVRVTGERNPDATSTRVDVDAFLVLD
jgi:hypothetical protein